MKIDRDKNLIWRKEIIKGGNGSFFMGGDGKLHFSGRVFQYIVINGDTLHNPYQPNYFNPPYINSYSPDGELIRAEMIDINLWLRDFEVNTSGDYIVSGFISDTLIVEQDTIIVPPDYTYHIIAKLNQSFEVVWYNLTIEEPSQDFSGFELELDQDNIIFSANGNKEVQIADTVLDMGFRNGMIIGELNDQGDLLNIETVHSSFEVRVLWEPMLDNCNNLVLSGIVQGVAALGTDTVESHWGLLEDAFIAKLLINEYINIDLGKDTFACKEYTIIGPANYLYYSWNDQISNQNQIAVYESGTYYFACSNGDGCWAYDTINIEILPGFQIDLGNDTTIDLNDTLLLSVAGQYESYVWSTGDTVQSITIIGNDFGLGTFPIWVEVSDGLCVERDSLDLTINDDFGINESGNEPIVIYPNPFVHEIIVKGISENSLVELYGIEGTRLFSKIYTQVDETERIELNHLTNGVYLIRVISETEIYSRKIVKW